MIRNLQRKITTIMAGVLLALFAVVFLTLNVLMQMSSAQKTELRLKTVADNDGFLPSDTGFGTLFYVKLDHQKNMIEVNYDMIFDMTLETVEQCTDKVLEQNKRKGTIGHYQFLVKAKDYGSIIVFAERGTVIQMLSDLVTTSSIVAGISCIVLLALSILLSRWAVKPVRDAFEKQRQFISDAGHELKTPLTIIVTNTDVLENEIGENIRLTHIRDQSNRMSQLIRDMLSLAKTDEDEEKTPFIAFDLSRAVLSTVLEFESTVFEEKKNLTYDIQENIRCSGNEQQIRQLVGILMDNAIKHSNPKGDIQVLLQKDGERNKLSVYNTGAGVSEKEQDRIFERFYRSDASRSRETGGYGLGLAIAKSIVHQHSGTISVSGTAGEWVRFTVKL